MGDLDGYNRRRKDPDSSLIMHRMRVRLEADPHLRDLADSDASIFNRLYDAEKATLEAEQEREQRREALFAPDPEPEVPGPDWELENLKEEAKETEGRPEDVVPLLEHMEKGGGD